MSLYGRNIFDPGHRITLLKEKGALLISGFNALPKEEQRRYNKEQLPKDMAHRLFLWIAVFAVGALLSYMVSSYMAWAAYILWAILFFGKNHWNADKAFEKYKQNSSP